MDSREHKAKLLSSDSGGIDLYLERRHGWVGVESREKVVQRFLVDEVLS